ncbi:hypothetical protein SO802_032681 [Lithocarpus litseifolius]|uniref:phosphopyruvate hydratase n=1 Tax=Lithocarpus litseifolius TaxID=425828 RepID=A0AAW2BCX9_9ROSI
MQVGSKLTIPWYELDGTVNEWGWCTKSLEHAILAVSLAVCKAGALHIANLAENMTIVHPVPAFNVINGGSHAGNKLAMQEFMILPVRASSFKEAMKMGVEVYHHLKAVIKKYGQDAINVGDEGGFAPNIQVVIGMDVAASEFYDSKDKTYDLNFKEENNDGSQKISGDSLKNVYKSFVSDYPIVSIEDPFDQDDWEHYAKLTAEIGQHVQIVGDDLLVTNPKRVENAIWEKTCNALLLKVVNQIGSVTESVEALKMSKHSGWGVMASHRSRLLKLALHCDCELESTACEPLRAKVEAMEEFSRCLINSSEGGDLLTCVRLELPLKPRPAICMSVKTKSRLELLVDQNALLNTTRIEEELGPTPVYAGSKFRAPAQPF